MSFLPYKRPNFFVVGVVKGGTTSLYHYLKQHPDIYLPPIKETNHFSSIDMEEQKFTREYAMDIDIDLKQYFEDGMKEEVHIAHVNNRDDYERLFESVDSEKAIGEVSNSYIISKSAAGAIKSYNPNAKIIALLRNPMTRIWSHYIMNLRDAKVSKPDFIFEVQHDYNLREKGWGISHQYVELGLYYNQVNQYLEQFGSDNCLFLMYEDFRDNPEKVLGKICRFLEIDHEFKFDFGTRRNLAALPRVKFLNNILVKTGMVKMGKKIFPRERRSTISKLLYSQKKVPAMPKKCVSFIRDFYVKDVSKLSELLAVELTDYWPEFKDED